MNRLEVVMTLNGRKFVWKARNVSEFTIDAMARTLKRALNKYQRNRVIDEAERIANG